MDYEVTPKSRFELRRLAKLFRIFFDIQSDLKVDIIKILDRLHEYDEDFFYEIVEDEELKDKYAETFSDQSRMRIRESTYLGAIMGNPRDRFTLTHELAHYLLHDSKSVLGLARSKDDSNPTPAFRRAEWQANVFAGEFMALYDLTKDFSALEICEKCGMSEAASQIQYEQYNKNKL